MFKKTIAVIIVCILAPIFAGCSGTAGNHPFREETLLDQNWGRSVETARYNQTLNPDAGKNLTPVEGLSGKAAGNTVEKYENSFKKETRQENTSTSTTSIISN